jgi:pimeloyl-ACP methyl ester carboxylesterase
VIVVQDCNSLVLFSYLTPEGEVVADTHVLETSGAEITYDVHGPLPPADGRPPLLMIGQPMDASGFRALAERFADRTVVTYDPRGLGRSTRSDGRVDNDPVTQAEDLHALIAALGAGPVDVFGSSGGAVTGLQLVTAHPDDVVTLVAHEPPLTGLLPDAEAAQRATDQFREAYQAKGWGHGMAGFMGMTTWQGEYTDEYFAQPAPDPAMFGMPSEDDGSRDDPLLSERSTAVTDYRLDVEALRAAPTRVVLAVGEESRDTYTFRTGIATAQALGQEAVVFPSHHGGFLDGEFGWPGKPDEFATRLREVLDSE